MAITNQERVGKAMELLRQGLAPFAEREFKNLHKAQGPAERSLVQELRDWRNKWAHPEPFSSDDADRALDDNGLVQSFPEIVRLAREGGKPKSEQGGLFADTEERSDS